MRYIKKKLNHNKNITIVIQLNYNKLLKNE